jgi:hypothetical protein
MHRHTKATRVLLAVFLTLITVSSAYSQNHGLPPQPPSQKQWCQVHYDAEKASSDYNHLDAFAKPSAQAPPPASFWIQKRFDLLGPGLTFSDWVGWLSAEPGNAPGTARLKFEFHCDGVGGMTGWIFQNANTSRDTSKFPGGGDPAVSSPVAAALIAMPTHKTVAVVSGKLFAAQAANAHPPAFEDSALLYPNGADGVYLAGFTKTAFVK